MLLAGAVSDTSGAVGEVSVGSLVDVTAKRTTGDDSIQRTAHLRSGTQRSENGIQVLFLPATTVSVCTAGISADAASAGVSAGVACFFLAISGFDIPFIGPLPASGFARSLDADTLLAAAGSEATGSGISLEIATGAVGTSGKLSVGAEEAAGAGVTMVGADSLDTLFAAVLAEAAIRGRAPCCRDRDSLAMVEALGIATASGLAAADTLESRGGVATGVAFTGLASGL